jgi:hypothetical protein
MPIGINTPQATALSQSKAALNALIAAAAPFHNLTLILYNVNIVPNQNTPYSALVQPTFTGYAPVAAIAFAAADNNPGGGATCYAPSVTFACTAGPASDIIYGWALVDAGLTTALLIVPLANPVSILAPGDAAVIIPQITYGGQ